MWTLVFYKKIYEDQKFNFLKTVEWSVKITEIHKHTTDYSIYPQVELFWGAPEFGWIMGK